MSRLWVLVALALGCDGGTAAPPGTMSVEEQNEALAVCEAYVARVCGCAEKEPSLAEQCDLARTQPEAVKLQMRMLGDQGQKLSRDDRKLTEIGVKKLRRACVDLAEKLDPTVCPAP